MPQSNVLDFVDSPWKSLPILRSGWGEKVEEQKKGMEWKLDLACKIRKISFKIIDKYKENTHLGTASRGSYHAR